MGFSVNIYAMKIKYSALVSDARGKLNGSVASKNRYGNYLRNKITPTNPQTPAQSKIRALFGSISQAWGGLTGTQRNAWDDFAREHPYTDIFGDSKILQGSAMYQKVNLNLAKLNLPTLSEPGLQTTTTPIEDVQGSLSLDLNGKLDELEVNVTFNGFATGNEMLVAYATPPKTPGITFVKNDFRMWWASPVEEDDTVKEFQLDTLYSQVFTDSIPEGSNVFIKIAVLNKTTGLQGQGWQIMLTA